MSAELAFTAVLALALGAVLGFVHFATLALVADRFAAGKTLGAVGIQALRLVLVGLVLFAAAWFGALPLIACLAGMLVGRWIFLSRMDVAP